MATMNLTIEAPSQRRGRGRPASRIKKVPMTVTLTTEAYEKLDEYARTNGLYKGQVLCQLIRKLKLEVRPRVA